jgi:hypothetical protein
MQHPLDFLDSINDRIASFVGTFNEFTPEDLGLDRRAGYRLYVDPGHTCIAILRDADKALQYYGGFEYVHTDYRRQMGDWVFYFDEDERVATAISCLNEGVE